LPCVKQLTTSNEFALSIMQDAQVFQRRIDRVSRIFVDQATLPVLEKMRGLGVRELAIGQYDTLQSVRQLAEIFPNLTMLDITKFGPPDRSHYHSAYTLVRYLFCFLCQPLMVIPKEDYLEALSRFPCLEALPDLSLWEGIQKLDEAKRSEAIMRLSRLCPRLIRMGHWNSKAKRVVDIILVRNGENVSWEERDLQYP
jgi:hypothetical protein